MSGIKGYSVMTSRTFMAVALATSIAILAITSVSTPSLADETHYRHHQKHRVSVGLGYPQRFHRDSCGRIVDVCDSSKFFG
jgi:hypothetical protein